MESRRDDPIELTFVIHLWREGPGWRGHVTDGEDKHYFEDGSSLVHFISEKLRLSDGVPFPMQRNESR